MTAEGQINISENEGLLSPEKVWGSSFRHIEIIGHGTGRDFEIKGLNLPRNWNKNYSTLEKIDTAGFWKVVNAECQEMGYELASMAFYKHNILKEVSIRNKKDSSVAKLFLDEFMNNNGTYITQGLSTLESVFVFQKFGATYLDLFDWKGLKHAYVEGIIGTGFGPIHMEIPEKYSKLEDIKISPYFQDQFRLNASNIAGRFGLDLVMLNFSDNGLLTGVDVTGDRTCYYLEPGVRSNRHTYIEHNVDHLDQAFALHTIVASFINHLLEKDDIAHGRY